MNRCLKILFLSILIPNLFVVAYGVESDKDTSFELESKELRGIGLLGSDPEYESQDAEIFGEVYSQFFHDSKTQLILDLDLFKDILYELTTLRESTLSGDGDYVQTVIQFFEPLQNYDVSAPCLADLSHFFWTIYNYAKTVDKASYCDNCTCTSNFKKQFIGYQWIFDVVDAIGKVPSAIFGGNNLWIGSWHTCRKVSSIKNKQGQKWNGQYCMIRFQPYNKNNPFKAFVAKPVDPVEECRVNSTHHFEEWSEEDKQCFTILPLLNLGICTPDTCTDYDVRKIIQFIYHSVEVLSDKRLVCDIEVKCSNSRPENQLLNDPFSMAVLCFMLIIISIIIFGSCYDIYVVHPIRETNHHRNNGIFEDGPILLEPDGWFVKFIMLFSVFSNIDYIMNTKTADGQIRCLHGARFLSMCWIIFGHTYYYICTSLTTDNLLQALHEFPKIFYNQLVVQATLAVDSFFFFSGLLTSYIFFKKLHKGDVQLTSWKTWFAYYIRRYLRLTPVYVMIMILHVTLFTYISDGPFWKPIDASFCRYNWWTNLLYINNFKFFNDFIIRQFNNNIQIDPYFQLHCFAPILIILIYKFERWGILASVLCLIGSALINLYITVVNNYPPAPLLTSSLEIIGVLNEYWEDLYVKPYVRCGPYIVGTIVGYLIFKTNRKFQPGIIVLAFGWLIAIVFGIYSVFGLYHYTKTDEVSTVWSTMYTLFGRPTYAIALGWITFACETGNAGKINSILGHKMFIPLSKLTFCAYLIHPILLQLYYLSRPTAFHFTHSFQLLYMFFVAVFMSYLSALCLSLAFETPVMNLDKLIFGDGRQKTRENIRLQLRNGIEDRLLNEPGQK